MNNEITTQTKKQSLMAVEKQYITSIASGMKDIVGSLGNYNLLCGYNILSAINLLLAQKGLTHQSPSVDKESLNNAIKFATIYALNTDNKEVFVSTRNEKRTDPATQKEYWITTIECKPQYKGQLKILNDFGRDVKKVYPVWVVREGDDFTYATYKGIEIVPPTWTPKNPLGKVLRVVVPIEYKDGFVDYRIAERESIATNIKAQIKQSLMRDKTEQKRVIALISDYTLDQLLEEKTIQEYINDTYTGISSEEMFITKLVINATKRVNIDYGSALSRELLEDTYDNADVYKNSHNAEDILSNNLTEIEMKDASVEEITTPQVEQAPTPTPTKREVEQERTMEDLFTELEETR